MKDKPTLTARETGTFADKTTLPLITTKEPIRETLEEIRARLDKDPEVKASRAKMRVSKPAP